MVFSVPPGRVSGSEFFSGGDIREEVDVATI